MFYILFGKFIHEVKTGESEEYRFQKFQKYFQNGFQVGEEKVDGHEIQGSL